MRTALKYSLSVRNTCRVNGIIDSLRHFPLLGRLFSDNLYSNREIKLVALILSVLFELIVLFVKKGLYFLLMVFLPALPLILFCFDGMGVEYDAVPYLNLLLYWTFLGGILNRRLMQMDMGRYYGIFMLRMDARGYTLAHLGVEIVKLLVGFLPFSLCFGMAYDVPLWLCVMIPFSVAGIKLFMDGLCLRRYRREGGTYVDAPFRKGWKPILLATLLMGGITWLQAKGAPIPALISSVGFILFLLLGPVGLWEILHFDRYREINQQQAQAMFSQQAELDNLSAKTSRDAISEEPVAEDTAPVEATRTGFDYLNTLFFRRHRKLLLRPCRMQSVVLLGLVVLNCLVIVWDHLIMGNPVDIVGSIDDNFLGVLPTGMFVMYLLNRGEKFTQALFHNCDRSLLSYAFFREPSNILTLFRLRLIPLAGMNLVPAAILAGGLCLIMALLGGPTSPVSYAVIVISILFLSIFFSLHNLTIYYLLQPYSIESKAKSYAYSIANIATLIVCIVLRDNVTGSLRFGVGCIAFCLVYFLVACVLVYCLAPKTFRLRH